MAIKKGWTGRFYEDFETGDVYEHPLGRTILAADNTWFSLLTMNTNPLHFDHHYSSKSEFGKTLVDSCLTLAIITGQSVADLTQNGGVNLQWDEVVMPHPVFEGDTIYAKSEVLEKRESKSRPNRGIVRVQTTGLNQNGVVVMEFKRTFMVSKRDSL
jgi:acyl dehydratase